MKVKLRQEVIRELRVSRGWTQEKLAELSGVHTRTIQRIENDGLASPQSLNALARVLDCEPEFLQHIETEIQAIDHRLTLNDPRPMPGQLTRAALNNGIWSLRELKRTGARRASPVMAVALGEKRPIMSYTERRSVEQFVQHAEKMQTWLVFGWVSWGMLFLGGFLTVNVLLIAQANVLTMQANPNKAEFLTAFFVGTSAGLLLMLIGGLGIHLLEKAREQNILAKLLQNRRRSIGV